MKKILSIIAVLTVIFGMGMMTTRGLWKDLYRRG